jgi:hypothetical protein
MPGDGQEQMTRRAIWGSWKATAAATAGHKEGRDARSYAILNSLAIHPARELRVSMIKAVALNVTCLFADGAASNGTPAEGSLRNDQKRQTSTDQKHDTSLLIKQVFGSDSNWFSGDVIPQTKAHACSESRLYCISHPSPHRNNIFTG